MYHSQTLALKYFSAAMSLFGVMTLFGLISAYYYLNPDFLFGILPFSIAKIIHINTLVIWLLMGFMASIYWFLPGELGRETAGIWAAEILFYVFCAAVAASPWCSSLSSTAAAPMLRCGLSIRAGNMSRRRVGRLSVSS